jgi:DNA-binding NtrC family response regulator
MNSETVKLVGNAPEFLRALHAGRMVAVTDAPVLILGERGTGKEVLAREIHQNSRRSAHRFSVLNCAGVSDDFFESAIQQGNEAAGCAGELFAQARGGTLFLDEVGELSAVSQGKLVRLIREYAGGVRVIASSSKDLHELVDRGEFRQDLYYSINIVPLELPSLRERVEDVVLLLKQFSGELGHQYGRKTPRYSVTTRNLLKAYHWPGNVRELRNFCERMVILMAGKTVQPEDLPMEMRRKPGPSTVTEFLLPENGVDLQQLEVSLIKQAVEATGGNRSKAARLLNISRDTLLYRMQKYAIEC